MKKAIIALGANLGNPKEALCAAVKDLASVSGIGNVVTSRFYTTSPVDSSGPDYVNAVAVIDTDLSPEELLKACQAIENAHGRVRPAGVVNAPRTLDLDVIDFEGVKSTDPKLIIPHPRMHERLFVLVPMTDVCPNWKNDGGKGLTEMIETVRKKHPDQKIRLLF